MTNGVVSAKNQIFLCGPVSRPLLRLADRLSMHMIGDTKCIWYTVVASYEYGLSLQSYDYWNYYETSDNV